MNAFTTIDKNLDRVYLRAARETRLVARCDESGVVVNLKRYAARTLLTLITTRKSNLSYTSPVSSVRSTHIYLLTQI